MTNLDDLRRAAATTGRATQRHAAFTRWLAAFALLTLFATSALAQETPPPVAKREPLTVAVREVPPFAMRDVDGEWEGLSISLWEGVADELDAEYELRELSLTETLSGLGEDSVDVAIVALTVTRQREALFDFSHPYHVGGLSLAFRDGGGSAWLETLKGFLSLEFLTAVSSLAIVLLGVGLALWLFERRRNREEFGGTVVRGLGSAFWWSAVTMTTVGYGDKTPRTLGGRLVGLIWMFASLILVAGFTASIAASLTANRLQSSLLGEKRLTELSVGTLEGSTAESLAISRGARLRRFATLDEALLALEAEEVDAVLHDEAVLAHRARTDHRWMRIAPKPLVRDDYGFAVPSNSKLREPINDALLAILPSSDWQELTRRFLGE